MTSGNAAGRPRQRTARSSIESLPGMHEVYLDLESFSRIIAEIPPIPDGLFPDANEVVRVIETMAREHGWELGAPPVKTPRDSARAQRKPRKGKR